MEQIGTVLIIILTAYLVLIDYPGMTIGKIMYHVLLFSNVSAPIRQLHRIYDDLNDALIYAEGFFGILEAEGEVELFIFHPSRLNQPSRERQSSVCSRGHLRANKHKKEDSSLNNLISISIAVCFRFDFGMGLHVEVRHNLSGCQVDGDGVVEV